MKSTLHINPLFGEGCVLQSGMPVKISVVSLTLKKN